MDLAQPHYTCRRLGHPDPADLDTLAGAYGWDIRGWPGLDTLIAVREITGLAPYIRGATANQAIAAELAHRLDTLRTGQTTARWTHHRDPDRRQPATACHAQRRGQQANGPLGQARRGISYGPYSW